MQIIMPKLNIIYSFFSFTDIVFTMKLCSQVSASACSFSSSWQHSPLSSFSFECMPQHFFGSIDTLHTLPCNHNQCKNILHTYQNVLSKNSDNYSYNFYTLSFLVSSMLQKYLSVSSVFHLLLSSTFHSEVCTFQSKGISSFTVKEGILHINLLLG